APGERAQIATQTTSHADTQAQPPGAALSPGLLYDLLLARIAEQRGRHRIALDAYTRAARQSRRRDLAEKALLLAMRVDAHARVVELFVLLGDLGAPAYDRERLGITASEISGDDEAIALRILVDIVRAYPRDEAVLREIASTLAEQAVRPGRAGILQRFHAIIAENPDQAALHWIAALLAHALQEAGAAAESIDAALQIRPGWQSAAMFKIAQLAATSISAMRDFAEGFLRAYPEAVDTRIQYAQLLLGAGRAKSALAHFTTVLRRQPDTPAALLAAGIAYAQLRNHEAAAAHFRMFLNAHPRHDQARLHIAEAETEIGNFDDAIAILHEISAPQYALDVQLQLARVSAARYGYQGGIARMLQLRPGNEEERIRIVLAQDALLREYDKPELSMKIYAHALTQSPQHADLRYHRGLLAAQMGNLELHERDMRAVLELQPDNAHAHNALGYTLADRNERLGEALALIERALELLPNDPFILDSMGWVQFRLGHHDSAIAYLRRALDIHRHAETAAHLGEALWAAGKRREAREIWKRGREWGPNNRTLQDTIKRLWQDAALHVPGARAMAFPAMRRTR
ncbi:MAG: tetratricopeptide repeat protein, partial [Gammaproteobacteria bacterium]